MSSSETFDSVVSIALQHIEMHLLHRWNRIRWTLYKQHVTDDGNEKYSDHWTVTLI